MLLIWSDPLSVSKPGILFFSSFQFLLTYGETDRWIAPITEIDGIRGKNTVRVLQLMRSVSIQHYTILSKILAYWTVPLLCGTCGITSREVLYRENIHFSFQSYSLLWSVCSTILVTVEYYLRRNRPDNSLFLIKLVSLLWDMAYMRSHSFEIQNFVCLRISFMNFNQVWCHFVYSHWTATNPWTIC